MSSLSNAQIIEATKSDPRFSRGLVLLKEKRYEEAVTIYEDLLKTMVESKPQEETLTLDIAPVYYEYGHALLALAEATANVFGTTVGNIPESNDDPNNENEEANNTIDDLNLAWEMLEVARVIYSKFPDDIDVEMELAKCYLRLGDLGMESDVFDQAKDDYEKALKLKTKIFEKTNEQDTTPLADLYCCLAISCIYKDTNQKVDAAESTNTNTSNVADEEDAEQLSNEEQGVKFYVLAGQVMSDNLFRVVRECSTQTQTFVKERFPPSKDIVLGQKEGTGKGKAKKLSSSIDLPFLQPDSIATLKEDYIACTLASKTKENCPSAGVDTTNSSGDNELTEKEAQVLEYMEIYLELKEKVDGLKEKLRTEVNIAPTVGETGTTTIGFGNPTTASFSSSTNIIQEGIANTQSVNITTTNSNLAQVNIVPVIKKRKILSEDSKDEVTKKAKLD